MPVIRLYIPLFSLTLLLSAFLLFAVQPMVGKMVLPLLGGTPQVWTTAMLFFQAMLLGGYGYAHLISRLPVRFQALVHLCLLCLCLTVLPVALPEPLPPPSERHPLAWQILLMTLAAGGPFFALAASAPLLQKWFAGSDHPDADNPYFLYAASNLGSMAALLSYPILIEPLMTVDEQSLAWTGGYILLAALTALAAFTVRKAETRSAATVPIPGRTKLLWLYLAFLPSALMLAVTTFVTTDIASIPMLWVVPLALYVATFAIAFARRTMIPRRYVTRLYSVLLALVVGFFCHNYLTGNPWSVLLHFMLFFFAALMCHMELARLRPDTGNLTAYYFILSLGGVLGGVFNAILAPALFLLPLEFPLLLALTALVRFRQDPSQPLTRENVLRSVRAYMTPLGTAALGAALCAYYAFYPGISGLAAAATGGFMLLMYRSRVAFALAAFIVLLLNPGIPWAVMQNILALDRNFFGVIRVGDDPARQMRTMVNGTTIHGAQPLIEPYRFLPMGYYFPQGPAGDVFGMLQGRERRQNIAALGLGVGSIACYTHPGRSFDFYEINPAVARIAQDTSLFTYLSGCGSPYKIIMGDGRLQIGNAPDGRYDLIFLDAFSSDNIPVHLLTLEAFALYQKKLKPSGMIAANISNRYLNLIPVVQAAADELHMHAVFKMSETVVVKEPDITAYPTSYAVLLNNTRDANKLIRAGWFRYVAPPPRTWTDNYADPLGTLGGLDASIKKSP